MQYLGAMVAALALSVSFAETGLAPEGAGFRRLLGPQTLFGLEGRFYQPRPKAWEHRPKNIHDPERVVHAEEPGP